MMNCKEPSKNRGWLYAIAKGKPLAVLIKEGCELSETVQGIADVVIKYSNPGEVDFSTFNS